MSFKRIKSIAAIPSHELALRITCDDCGRMGLFDAASIARYFHANRWNGDLAVAGSRFRCDGCGSRRCTAGTGALPLCPPPLDITTTKPLSDHEAARLRRARRG